MKIIISGTRTVSLTEKNIDKFDQLMKEVMNDLDIGLTDINEIVVGGARGVDELGETWAEGLKLPVNRIEAQWSIYGKAAGPMRNQEMLGTVGNDGVLVAVWDGTSRGTRHIIEEAKKIQLSTFIKFISPTSWDMELFY